MSDRAQPPLPADDDEARFDDEGSAIDHPEPLETERTKTGFRVPIPKRDEFFDNLKRASQPDREHGGDDEPRRK